MIEKLGRYRITGELGKGAGGVVYSAIDPETGAEVALKALPTSDFGLDRAALLERLKREAESTAKLDHPNIVKVTGLEQEAGGRYFLTMEMVKGRTLEHGLRNQEPFAPKQVAEMISMAAAALDYAHGSGMVHRDVKPANLMIIAGGGLKVMDFGAVKLLDQEQKMQLTRAGTTIGSPHYISPEQLMGGEVDGRSDQFSLAVIAYELLVGRKPFQAEAVALVMFQIATEKHPAPHSIRPELPAALSAVFDRGLAKKREERYESCSDFARDLIAALQVDRPKQSRLWWIVAAAVVAIAAIVFFLTRS
ncbi:MAG: serine/threonine-protein kinase [Bryobacteraceae bacterium]